MLPGILQEFQVTSVNFYFIFKTFLHRYTHVRVSFYHVSPGARTQNTSLGASLSIVWAVSAALILFKKDYYCVYGAHMLRPVCEVQRTTPRNWLSPPTVFYADS